MPIHQYRHQRNSFGGFTLVELAIVITIIGLLIGGVLKGQEMIQNARVTATIAQIDSFRAATHAFQDRFDNLPGDYSAARARLPHCSEANHCHNGNGDGYIGPTTPLTEGWYNNSGGVSAITITHEASQFWKHLALADLVSGVNPSAGAVVTGQSHPASPFNSAFLVNFTGAATNPSRTIGKHAILLRNEANQQGGCPALAEDPHSSGGQRHFCGIAPAYAALIDRKTDDGYAMSGYTRAVSSIHRNGCGTANVSTGNVHQGSNGYDESRKIISCDMGFMLN